MAINITSLFQDILESPEQKQQRQMMEGFKRRDDAVSGLTGLAQVAAPLVGTMAELQPQRNEMLQRGVGRLLGRDVRSTSEKVSDALKGFNPQDPQSVSQTTQMLQQLGLGPQAAQLSSMALEEQKKNKLIDLQTKTAQQSYDLNASQEERAIDESAARLLAADRAYEYAGTSEERAAARAVMDTQANVLSQIDTGLSISQRAQEQIDRSAREASRSTNAARIRAMGEVYEPLAILMETPGSDVVGVMGQVTTLSANLLGRKPAEYKALTKDEAEQALAIEAQIQKEDRPLYNPWLGGPPTTSAQFLDQVALAKMQAPNAGMEAWVAAASAKIMSGVAQATEESVDAVMANMPGATPPPAQDTPLPFNIDVAAAAIAPVLTSPPVPIPTANAVPSAPAGSAQEQMLASADRMTEEMAGARRQREVDAVYTNLVAKNNSDKAAGKPVKTPQELKAEAQSRVNQKYSQGN